MTTKLITQCYNYIRSFCFPNTVGADFYDVEDKHWVVGYPVPIANPMSRYPQVVEILLPTCSLLIMLYILIASTKNVPSHGALMQ